MDLKRRKSSVGLFTKKLYVIYVGAVKAIFETLLFGFNYSFVSNLNVLSKIDNTKFSSYIGIDWE